MLPRRNASGHFVLHTVVEGRNVFPKESTRCDLSKVEWFSRRNVLGSKKVGGTGSVEGRIISPKECDSLINIRMGHYGNLFHGACAARVARRPRGREH